MAELEKVIRVIKKIDTTAPHSVVLTLDATTGQNALSQVEIFGKIAGVTGLVMTKLDGTARGGILVAISQQIRAARPCHRRWRERRRSAIVPCARFRARHSGRSIENTEGTDGAVKRQQAKQETNPMLKLALEMGPLAIFFGTYAWVKGDAAAQARG